MWSMSEVERVVGILRDQLEKPYAIGYEDPKTKKWVVRGKPSLADQDPKEFDCSGLSRYIIGQGMSTTGKRIILPHGTYNQIKVCRPLGTEKVRPLDLGFSESVRDSDERVDHVVIREDDFNVIEARGKPFDRVVRRPVKAWESYPGFWGWFRVFGIHD